MFFEKCLEAEIVPAQLFNAGEGQTCPDYNRTERLKNLLMGLEGLFKDVNQRQQMLPAGVSLQFLPRCRVKGRCG